MTNSLRAAINSSVTTIKLENAISFPASGFVQIDSEIIQYSYTSDLLLMNCVRGVGGTSAASHLINATVTYIAALTVPHYGLDLNGQTLDAEVRLTNGTKLTVSGDDLIFTNALATKSVTLTLV